MSKRTGKGFQTFLKNLWKHFKRVVSFRESPLEAMRRIGEDIHKLRHGAKVARRSGDEKEARRLLDKGRRAYNEKRYTEAESYLIRALECDERLGWAHLFMGHTCYQLNRLDEAATHWHRARSLDPSSEVADRARKKLEGLGAKRREVLEELEQHVQQSHRAKVDL